MPKTIVKRHPRRTKRKITVVSRHPRIYKTMQPKAVVGKIPKDGYIYEPKADGTRIILYKDGQSKLINRRNVDATNRFPELQDIKLRATSAILDGEVVVKDRDSPFGDFKKLAMRDHLKDQKEIKLKSKKMPAQFIAFDILNKNGEDLTSKPLLQRKKILNELVPDNSNFIKEIEWSHNPKNIIQKMKKAKGEGIIAKKIDSPYEQKDSKLWQKFKFSKTSDLAILGYTEGAGKRKGLFGALIAGYPKKKGWEFAGKAGTGFTEKNLKTLKKEFDKYKVTNPYFHRVEKVQWLKPHFVGRFQYAKLTPQKIMREPRFVEIRMDIPPKKTHLEKVIK